MDTKSNWIEYIKQSQIDSISVYSRFPSMESNIETRHSGSNYFINNSHRSLFSTSNGRLNGSLLRKFNTSSIPIRNGYHSYSHGKYLIQSIRGQWEPLFPFRINVFSVFHCQFNTVAHAVPGLWLNLNSSSGLSELQWRIKTFNASHRKCATSTKTLH